MTWLGVSLLGGVAGVDATSIGQVMVSRPFIAATLTGLLAGRPQEGLVIGAILELFALVILPVGAARYPDSGPAAVAATAAYMSAAAVMSPSMMLLAVLFALGWERVGGYTVILMRRFNEVYVALAPLDGPDSDRSLERRHLSAIAVDFLRAVALALGGGLIGRFVLELVSRFWSMNASVAPAILSIGVSCMVGATLPLFGGVRARMVWLLIGVGCGSLLVILR